MARRRRPSSVERGAARALLTYGPTERALLWTLGGLGLIGVNGASFYGLLQPGVVEEAMRNPIALAFIGKGGRDDTEDRQQRAS